jgi:hypothetical protein
MTTPPSQFPEIEGHSQLRQGHGEQEETRVHEEGMAIVGGDGEMNQGVEGDELNEEAVKETEEVRGEADGEVDGNAGGEAGEGKKVKKKRERKEPASLEREGGKSLFPFSRVQKAMKADRVGL